MTRHPSLPVPVGESGSPGVPCARSRTAVVWSDGLWRPSSHQERLRRFGHRAGLSSTSSGATASRAVRFSFHTRRGCPEPLDRALAVVGGVFEVPLSGEGGRYRDRPHRKRFAGVGTGAWPDSANDQSRSEPRIYGRLTSTADRTPIMDPTAGGRAVPTLVGRRVRVQAENDARCLTNGLGQTAGRSASGGFAGRSAVPLFVPPPAPTRCNSVRGLPDVEYARSH